MTTEGAQPVEDSLRSALEELTPEELIAVKDFFSSDSAERERQDAIVRAKIHGQAHTRLHRIQHGAV
jgi:hypothetical protein